MIPDFPIPDSGFPNSEFRMAYGESGIPHHETLDPRGAHERIRGRRGGVGHGMSYLGVLCKGCLTLECYANSGGRTSDVGGGTWAPYLHRKWPPLNWLQLRFTGSKSGSGWQTGRLATAGAWAMAPQTSAKAPSRGF